MNMSELLKTEIEHFDAPISFKGMTPKPEPRSGLLDWVLNQGSAVTDLAVLAVGAKASGNDNQNYVNKIIESADRTGMTSEELVDELSKVMHEGKAKEIAMQYERVQDAKLEQCQPGAMPFLTA